MQPLVPHLLASFCAPASTTLATEHAASLRYTSHYPLGGCVCFGFPITLVTPLVNLPSLFPVTSKLSFASTL